MLPYLTSATASSHHAEPLNSCQPQSPEALQREGRVMVRQEVVFRFLGTILLDAAALKTVGGALESPGSSSLLSESWIRLAVLDCEILLGLWLLSAPLLPTLAWWVAFL